MNREPHQLRELGELLAFFKQPEPPERLARGDGDGAAAEGGAGDEAEDRRPRAPCQEVVLRGAEIDLGLLPIQTCWPGEPAPLITWPLVVTKGPGDAARGRLQPRHLPHAGDRAANSTLMRWLQASRRRPAPPALAGRAGADPLPAAAVIGADPGTILAAVTPVPDTMSEYQFAGLLRGQRVELVGLRLGAAQGAGHGRDRARGPWSASRSYGDEGPYGDHTGYYNAVEPFPVFTVTAMTMRRDPIYLSTFTGRPPDEPSVLGEALNEVFLPLFRQQFPEIVDFWLPPEGCSLPGRGGLDQEGLSRPRQAGDAGRLVVSAPVHVHQVRDRRSTTTSTRATGRT